MQVWVDQDLCTGDGLCEERCPGMFAMGDDGLSYTRASDVPAALEDSVLDAAEECPGECIFVEA
jgi:ferredoxin